MEEWVRFFRELGFPAAVAIFVLWRVDHTLHELIAEVRALRADFERSRRAADA